MEFKKIIIILTVTIIAIFGLMSGVSYAWYAYSNAETNINGTTIKETPTVIFTQTEFISSTTTMPIYDEDRYTYANKNSFNITFNENLKKYQIGLEIMLTNINMASELKISNYKYELVQNNKVVAKGDFSTLGDSASLIVLPTTIIKPTTYPETYNYELYIWLSEDNTDQNYLMNKGFNAKIKVNSALKRK